MTETTAAKYNGLPYCAAVIITIHVFYITSYCMRKISLQILNACSPYYTRYRGKPKWSWHCLTASILLVVKLPTICFSPYSSQPPVERDTPPIHPPARLCQLLTPLLDLATPLIWCVATAPKGLKGKNDGMMKLERRRHRVQCIAACRQVWQTDSQMHTRAVPYRILCLQSVAGRNIIITRMWANAQRDCRPAEHRWRPLFNAAKFGWRLLLHVRCLKKRPTFGFI